jgi:hypothetical protein
MPPEDQMPDRVETVALLGAGGTMGRGIGANLTAAFDVRAWNRTRERIDDLVSHAKVEVCDSPREAADGADVVLTGGQGRRSRPRCREEAGLELPMLAAIRERMAAVAEEHGDEDLAAVYLASSPSA